MRPWRRGADVPVRDTLAFRPQDKRVFCASRHVRYCRSDTHSAQGELRASASPRRMPQFALRRSSDGRGAASVDFSLGRNLRRVPQNSAIHARKMIQIVCEVRDEHVLQVRLRGVRVVARDDDPHHPQDIRHVGRLEAQGQEKPEPPRRSLVLREPEGHERGRENAEGVDARAAREGDLSFDPLFDFSIVSTKGTRRCPYRG